LNILKKLPNKFEILSLIAGGLLTFSFAPFNQFWLGILCPALFLLCLQKADAMQGMLRGLLFGTGLFGTGVSWVYVSIHTYGNAGVILSCFITALLVAFLALFPALLGYLLAKYAKPSKLPGMLLAFPALWVALEWIRSWLFTGFPWLLLGYSQINSPLSGYATVLSVFGVSLATAFTSAALIAMWQNKKKARLYLILALFAIWGAGMALKSVEWSKPAGPSLSIALVQGDIPQATKWSQYYQDQILNTYQKLNQEALGSQLIFWPEAAIPALPEQVPNFIKQLTQSVKQSNTALMLGIPLYNYSTQQYYNAAVVIGNGQGVYLKRHLVPFGEYVPLLNVLGPLLDSLNIPMSGMTPGPDGQALPIMQNIPVAVFICYESAFPEEFRDDMQNAELIATLSDDSWFGHSLGFYQHEEMDQMRAIETARYIVRATNSGETSVIDTHGKVIAKIPSFQAGVLKSTVVPMGGNTPWMIIGIWPLLGLILVMLGLFIILSKEKA
jgi:apolipoprotein N-acyltransferase